MNEKKLLELMAKYNLTEKEIGDALQARSNALYMRWLNEKKKGATENG